MREPLFHSEVVQRGGETQAAPEAKREEKLRIWWEKKEEKPRKLTTTTLFLLSHLPSLPPSFQPYFHSAPPLLVTTATGEGQKTKADEKCAD